MKKKIVSGWGNYPRVEANIIYPPQGTELTKLIDFDENYISMGLGRSYGDSALNDNVINFTKLNGILSFDIDSGIIHCEAGVSLAEIIKYIISKGWFLPVTPGTKYVTLGGAIAADIHGKNHHLEGTFCDHITKINMVLGDGSYISCSPSLNSDLFHATCGGMGLTGIILDAELKLKPVAGPMISLKNTKTNNLRETVDVLEKNKNIEYSVAWIDCQSKKDSMGRGIVMLGSHSKQESVIKKNREYKIPIPTPGFILNKYSIKYFNSFYYHFNSLTNPNKNIYYEPYFYPLDKIKNWNILYGKDGFFQYQFVIPYEAGFEGLSSILDKIVQSGYGSFLAVLKNFGEQNNNLLSFPKSGFTLALDIKFNKSIFKFLDLLDEMILEMNGRVYLAKDSRMSETTFKSFYPNWEIFQSVRKKYYGRNIFSSLQSKRIGLDK